MDPALNSGKSMGGVWESWELLILESKPENIDYFSAFCYYVLHKSVECVELTVVSSTLPSVASACLEYSKV